MSDHVNMKSRNSNKIDRSFSSKVALKIKAKNNPNSDLWFGLGMMGLIGWSVVVPTLLGAALGSWLDSRYQMDISWTLTLLFIGLVVGCLNAWHWVGKENSEMGQEQKGEK